MSQRRRKNIQTRADGGHDLSGQDVPINDGSSWVAAGQHKSDYDDDEDEDEEDEDDLAGSENGLNGEHRGRTQEAMAA